VDASGNIYVLNNGSGNVTKYNSAGTFQSTFLSGYTSAQAITIDGAGNFYVSDNAATNTVYVYNQSGTLLTSKAISDPRE
jgi:DNA-binding beta-propeller fold protein YncE